MNEGVLILLVSAALGLVIACGVYYVVFKINSYIEGGKK